MINIIAILMIGFILGVNLENLYSNETYSLFKKSEEINEEYIKSKDSIISNLRDRGDYYKKAYEDIVKEYIDLMKIMNRGK